MRLLQVLVACAVAAGFVVDGATATKLSGNAIIQTRPTLRSLKVAGAADGGKYQEDEKRAIINGILKKAKSVQKLLPGTKAYKQAAALKEAAKKAELEKFVATVTQNDDNLFKFFRDLYSQGKGRQNVENIFKKFGKTQGEATHYANRYYDYITIANAGVRNNRGA